MAHINGYAQSALSHRATISCRKQHAIYSNLHSDWHFLSFQIICAFWLSIREEIHNEFRKRLDKLCAHLVYLFDWAANFILFSTYSTQAFIVQKTFDRMLIRTPFMMSYRIEFGKLLIRELNRYWHFQIIMPANGIANRCSKPHISTRAIAEPNIFWIDWFELYMHQMQSKYRAKHLASLNHAVQSASKETWIFVNVIIWCEGNDCEGGTFFNHINSKICDSIAMNEYCFDSRA